jgi:Ca-activated chloride channel family protein
MKRSSLLFRLLFRLLLAGLLFAILTAARHASADTGVLIPHDKTQPDPSVLSLAEMEIDVRIDNGDARVWVRQIFLNHTAGIEEGNYVFALPSRTTVSDFAVWDGPVRIPAVILERKRAEEIYADLKAQAIDPGLLEQGERGVEDARRNSDFTAHIVPIQPYGTKRLEIEYHQSVPVENLKSYFLLPLHPDAYQAQTAGRVHVHFELRSAQAIKNFSQQDKLFPLKISTQDAHTIVGDYNGTNITLSEDMAATWNIDPAGTNHLDVLTYRNPNGDQPAPDEMSPTPSHDEPGFFEASAVIGTTSGTAAVTNKPRNVVVLFDTSLSMQWEKLERSYAAMARLLNSLSPQDHFNLVLFNTQAETFAPAPVAADKANVARAIEFVRASHLRGGTDLQHALDAGLAQCTLPDSTLVLLSDGGADHGLIQSGKLSEWYSSRWNSLPADHRPRTDIFAIGDDANLPLLRMLARDRGVFESVLSTEPIDYKLDAFLSKIGHSPVSEMRFSHAPPDAVQLVYPLNDTTFPGSMASWIGQYQKPRQNVAFTLHGVSDGRPFDLQAKVSLPAESLGHAELPRLWAQARVQALLEQIERDGETQATVDEIIRLARKYKFVTPYTSFLAVPRALLRPRVIRPGDPVLRVKTDPSIVSVIALFPFGLTKPLRYLGDEDVWQTRFLAPSDMQDGVYNVRLILRDKTGHAYRESKTFVIASKPPTVHVRLDKTRFRRGDILPLRVSASQSTRALSARLEGLAPVSLHWSSSAAANTGQLVIPPDLPAGSYTLTVTAEDIAHNLGTEEVRIEVVP